MGFWIFMVIMLLLIPIIMIGFGRYFMKSAPKEINLVFGYRTSMSMKNKETWEFAHNYCGKIWYYGGRLLLLSILFMFLVIGKDEDTIGNLGAILMYVQLIFLVGSIFPTERALRKNFDKKGNRRK
ncbi:MAG: SdpI family protein [Eubacteriales bacterium]